MSGNPLRIVGIVWRACALAGALALVTGCGMKISGPGETVSIQPLATEDLSGSCQFDINMPDQPGSTLGTEYNPSAPKITEVGALVVYERGDSANLFNDSQVQNMAATLHLVTVFAHECDSKVTGDLQADATKGPARALFAALAQYAADSHHPEVANVKLVLSGFSAAGVLSVSMAQNYPSQLLGILPYAAGSAYLDLDTVAITPAMAQVPALILANAYDPESGVQRSLRLFNRGWGMGAPWGFGVQNNTGHCCTLSTRDVMIPWVTALLQTQTVMSAAGTATLKPQSAAASPAVRFLCYTDGYYDAQGESNCFIYSASVLPSTAGGPQAGWLPDAATSQAWLSWVTSPGTN